MTATQAGEAQRIAEDVADLVTLARERRNDSMVEAVVSNVLDRHMQGNGTAVRISLAAQMLNVSATTVRSWIERGVLEQVADRPRKVSAVSLGHVLALIRVLEKTGQGRERLLQALERLRDRGLLTRARKAAEEAETGDFIVYDEDALAELRRG